MGATDRRLVRVDFRFPGTRFIVEVLGYRWHRGSKAQFAAEECWVIEQLRVALATESGSRAGGLAG